MSIQEELLFGKRYEEVAARLYAAQTWPNCDIGPCPAFADVDFVVTCPKKGLVALLEIKSRRVSSTAFTSTIVSLRKHHTGRYAWEFLKVPTIAIVVFTDTTATFSLRETPDKVAPIYRQGRA